MRSARKGRRPKKREESGSDEYVVIHVVDGLDLVVRRSLARIPATRAAIEAEVSRLRQRHAQGLLFVAPTPAHSLTRSLKVEDEAT